MKKTLRKLVIHRAGWIIDAPSPDRIRVHRGGALVLDAADGKVVACGDIKAIAKSHPRAKTVDHGKDAVITPGFVDGHVHAPQMEMMASAGYSLLEWLTHHTFPTEAKYADSAYARKRWDEFCQELLHCGTTTAAIYATSHTRATTELLKAASDAGVRAYVGKVLMDRNAPENLLQKADTALAELETLIGKWKDHPLVQPSITVRFAPTSTPQLLKGAGELAQKYPQLVVQTHLSETVDEVKWVKELFPKSAHYTEVYEKNNLLGKTTLLGHCIHLHDDEVRVLKRQKSSLVHCPSSNFFLGSGLFPYKRYQGHGLSVCLGSDVGAGWDLSLQTAARSCYEAQALQKLFMKPAELLHLMTRAGALALNRTDIGVFDPGCQGDFVVHDLRLRKLVHDRSKRVQSEEELLSALLFLGGESTVGATYVAGLCRFERATASAKRRRP